MTAAVNAVSSANRTIPEIKNKVVRHKGGGQKKARLSPRECVCDWLGSWHAQSVPTGNPAGFNYWRNQCDSDMLETGDPGK